MDQPGKGAADRLSEVLTIRAPRPRAIAGIADRRSEPGDAVPLCGAAAKPWMNAFNE